MAYRIIHRQKVDSAARWPSRHDLAFSVVARLTKLWNDTKFAALFRGISFTLTRDQFIDFWLEDARFDRRERGEDLTMARIDKRRGYSWDNIECLTRAEDLARQGRGFKGSRARPVFVGARRFDSLVEAAKTFGVSRQVAQYRAKARMKTEHGEWVYEDQLEGDGL
jgi:hypothetical protein